MMIARTVLTPQTKPIVRGLGTCDRSKGGRVNLPILEIFKRDKVGATL